MDVLSFEFSAAVLVRKAVDFDREALEGRQPEEGYPGDWWAVHWMSQALQV